MMEIGGIYACTPVMSGIPRVVRVTSQCHWCRTVENDGEEGFLKKDFGKKFMHKNPNSHFYLHDFEHIPSLVSP